MKTSSLRQWVYDNKEYMLFLERQLEKSQAPLCMTNNTGHRYDQSSESA